MRSQQIILLLILAGFLISILAISVRFLNCKIPDIEDQMNARAFNEAILHSIEEGDVILSSPVSNISVDPLMCNRIQVKIYGDLSSNDRKVVTDEIKRIKEMSAFEKCLLYFYDERVSIKTDRGQTKKDISLIDKVTL